MRYFSYITTTLLGLVFLVSAYAKAWDAEAFADMLKFIEKEPVSETVFNA